MDLKKAKEVAKEYSSQGEALVLRFGPEHYEVALAKTVYEPVDRVAAAYRYGKEVAVEGQD